MPFVAAPKANSPLQELEGVIVVTCSGKAVYVLFMSIRGLDLSF